MFPGESGSTLRMCDGTMAVESVHGLNGEGGECEVYMTHAYITSSFNTIFYD